MSQTNLFRQVSGNQSEICSVCQDPELPVGPNKNMSDVRMACGCAFHYLCLVAYIKAELGDKEAVRKTYGIRCPNAKSTVGTCKYLGAGTEAYTLGPVDLENIVSYAESNPGLVASETSLSREEAAKLRDWLEKKSDKRSSSAVLPSELDLDMLFIEATSKKCPKCPNRESHFHGHKCHHVTGGCRACKTEFCYKCLATKEENINKRGAANNCICGYWSNFCKPLLTRKDISDYLVLEPYPFDRRCGCQICNECVKGYPCGTCDGNCAVCRGIIARGPNELGTEWAIRPADWVEGPDDDDSMNSNVDLPDPDQSEIVRAVRFDNIHRVNEIVTGPNCPNPQELGEALIVACEGSRVPIARVLINAGAFLNAIRPYNRDTCLHSICRQGEVGVAFIGLVRMLVDRQADVNMRNSDGVTPLHCAIVNDHEEIVTILVLNGNADLNIRDNDGNTAFLKVCASGNERLVRMFLSTGRADTNTRSNDGSSCLHWAFRNNRKSIVKILALELNCDPNFRTNDGATPLHWAFRSDYEDNVRVLLNAGADVNLRNAHGSTPLHCACMYGSISMARILVLEAHADVNKQSNDGSTPLHRACSNGFENIARILALDARADVNVLDRYGRTPLHEAIVYNNDSIAKMLICEVHANLKPTGAAPFPFRTRRIVAELLGDSCTEEMNIVGIKQQVYDGPSNRPIPTQTDNVDTCSSHKLCSIS